MAPSSPLQTLPREWREYLPHPFTEVRFPLTDAELSDTVGTLLAQSAGLATPIRFALTHDDMHFHLAAMESATEVLMQYLQTANALFQCWEASNRPHPQPSQGKEDAP